MKGDAEYSINRGLDYSSFTGVIEESGIEQFLDDLYHDWASEKNNRVGRID